MKLLQQLRLGCNYELSGGLTAPLVCVCVRDEENTYVVTRVEMLLRESKEFSAFTKTQALEYLGADHHQR